MQVKGKKSSVTAMKLGIAGAMLLATGLVGSQAKAQVTGVCVNCHTMHNSQNGNTQVQVGDATVPAYAAWNGNVGTSIVNGSTQTEQNTLLKSDCVGCHSNTGNATIVTVGTTKIPIVFNTTAYPSGASTATTALAGGNFYGVAHNDSYGHNVRGISIKDATLSYAPGSEDINCADSCHESLTYSDTQITLAGIGPQYSFGGCRGCHTQVAHHNPADPSYRFLGGHDDGVSIKAVDGGGTSQPNPYEDTDWEQTKSATDHNFYKRQDATALMGNTSIGAFCAGCHKSFHALGGGDMAPISPVNNGGDPNTDNKISANSGTNPWLRHPSGANIPNDGEYAALFGVVDYNPDVPVARAALAGSSKITAGDQVMCLSCHRAHGSDKPDALRFDYAGMISHTPNVSTDGTGCFYCHTTKDDGP